MSDDLCKMGRIDETGQRFRCTLTRGHADQEACNFEPCGSDWTHIAPDEFPTPAPAHLSAEEAERIRKQVEQNVRESLSGHGRAIEERARRAIPADVRTAAALERIATAFEGFQIALRMLGENLPNIIAAFTAERPRSWKDKS